MKYPTMVLINAQKELQKRRNEYKIKSENKKNKLYREIPQLKEINKSIASLIKTAISNNLSKTEIKECSDNLINMRSHILKSQGLSENSLSDVYFCSICNDEGFIESKICSCYSTLIKNEAYKLSNLSEKIRTENFDTFNFSVFTNKKEIEYNYKIAKKFCEDTKKDKNNLILIGSTGTGKTFLSSCIAKAFLESNKSVFYLTATKFSNLLDDAKFKKSDTQNMQEYINYIYDCDLLILDDLGTEYTLPYSQAQLFDILETRNTVNKNTVISTNLKLDELTQRYSARLISRILGNYEVLAFTGQDLRYNL